MFNMKDQFSSEDGFHIVEVHSEDLAFRHAVVAAMKVAGYEVYGMSVRDDCVQYNFVTLAKALELQEQHHASCRNSLGGLLDPQCIGRAFRPTASDSSVKIVDAEVVIHYPITGPESIEYIDVDVPKQRCHSALAHDVTFAPDSVMKMVDDINAATEPPTTPPPAPVVDTDRKPFINDLEPGIGARCFGSGNLDD